MTHKNKYEDCYIWNQMKWNQMELRIHPRFFNNHFFKLFSPMCVCGPQHNGHLYKSKEVNACFAYWGPTRFIPNGLSDSLVVNQMHGTESNFLEPLGMSIQPIPTDNK